MLKNFSKSLANPQAIKTSVSEAAMRKVDKMFDNAAKPKINVSKTPPVQAVKVPGKMGPSRRNDTTGNTRKTGGAGAGNSRMIGKGLFNRMARRI
jgi:hypothetical protein